MKNIPIAAVLLGFLSLPLVASAAYTTTFNGFNSALEVNGQDGWGLAESAATVGTDNTFVVDGVSGNKFAALGGLFNDPLVAVPTAPPMALNLTRSANNEPAAGSTFTASFALINRNSNAGLGTVFTAADPDDHFGFTLRDSGGPVFSISYRVVGGEAVRNPFRITTENGGAATQLNPNGVAVSDFAAPALSTFTITFSNVGGNLNYSGTAAAGTPFSGSILGKGTTTFTSVGIDWDVQGTPAGQNFILVDSLSLVPEPSAALMGLLSLGLLGVRRRR